MGALSGALGSSFIGDKFPYTHLDRANGLEIHSGEVSRSSPERRRFSQRFWRDVVNDRRLGEEIVGNRFEIVVPQIFETVLNDLPHRALDLALLGCHAGPQELDQVAPLPLTDPGILVGCDIGNELTVRSVRCPRQRKTGPCGPEEIARGMALSTMRERGHEVSSSIISGTLLGSRLERARGKEQ